MIVMTDIWTFLYATKGSSYSNSRYIYTYMDSSTCYKSNTQSSRLSFSTIQKTKKKDCWLSAVGYDEYPTWFNPRIWHLSFFFFFFFFLICQIYQRKNLQQNYKNVNRRTWSLISLLFFKGIKAHSSFPLISFKHLTQFL